MYAYYIDASIHQIGYITGLFEKAESVLYTDSETSLKIIKEDFPAIRVKFFPSVKEIIEAMRSDGIKILILQDFHYKMFKILKKDGIKFVQLFHGTSDKTYNVNRKIVHYDLVCLSGRKMLQDVEKKGLNINKNCRVTGNLKADMIFNGMYNRNKEIEKLGLDPGKKNVLYAPTWMDGMGNSSFKKFGLHLPEYFPEEYQLTIKLHPNLHLYKGKLVKMLRNSIKNKKNILLLEGGKKIYDIIPVMAASDALMTDVSGVSHEYIAFLRPMMFLDNRNILRFFYGRGRMRIWNAGDVVNNLKELQATIRKNLEEPDRYVEIQREMLQDIYSYTDGKSAERILNEIRKLY